jgi:hypothetical protein
MRTFSNCPSDVRAVLKAKNVWSGVRPEGDATTGATETGDGASGDAEEAGARNQTCLQSVTHLTWIVAHASYRFDSSCEATMIPAAMSAFNV